MPNIDSRLLTGVAILLIAFLGVKTLASLRQIGEPSLNPHTIYVTGDEEVFATPDIAEFSFSVSADAKTVGDAQDTVTGKMDAILASLNTLGIADEDIRTTDYSVYPKYTYQAVACQANGYCPPGRQIPDGYTVSHTVTVKVRKTSDAGQALSLVGGKGATNISSLSFTVDDPDKILAQARDKAVAEARERAKVLAKSLGVRLGRVVAFTDNTYSPWPVYAREGLGMGGAVSADVKVAPTLPTGQNKITSNVTITYEIR